MISLGRKPVVKVSFNEDKQEESYYFINRIIEKILIEQLDLTLQLKGTLLMANSDEFKKR